jgi:hypothetical protein
MGALRRLAQGAVLSLALILVVPHGSYRAFAAEGGDVCGVASPSLKGRSLDRVFFAGPDPFAGIENTNPNEGTLRISSEPGGLSLGPKTSPGLLAQPLLHAGCLAGPNIDATYSFAQTSPFRGFALTGGARVTDDPENLNIDNRLKSTAVRLLESESALHYLRVNVSWNYNGDPSNAKYDDNYALVVGYDYRVGRDMMLIFDFVHERDGLDGREANIAEAGVGYHIFPLAVFAVGAGASFDEASPGFRSGLTFQYSF